MSEVRSQVAAKNREADILSALQELRVGQEMRTRILVQCLRFWTQAHHNAALKPAESKELLVWCLDLQPLEWDCWRN